jgi:hypothetical protein
VGERRQRRMGDKEEAGKVTGAPVAS